MKKIHYYCELFTSLLSGAAGQPSAELRYGFDGGTNLARTNPIRSGVRVKSQEDDCNEGSPPATSFRYSHCYLTPATAI